MNRGCHCFQKTHLTLALLHYRDSREQSDHFNVSVLTSNSNAALLIRQAEEFRPDIVVIADESKIQDVRDGLRETSIKVYGGKDALSEVVQVDTVDIVLTALVGYAGLKPTLNALKSGKDIALANKGS